MNIKRAGRFAGVFTLLAALLFIGLTPGCQDQSPGSSTTQPYKPVNVNDPSDIRIPSGGQLGR